MSGEQNLMPDLQSCLLCDDVRQERNGKFMLIGLFDAIGAQQVPLRYPKLFMVSRWCSGAGKFVQKSRILLPDMGSELVTGKEIPVHLPHPEATSTNVEVFMNVDFKHIGTHWVEVQLDGQLKIRFPLRVHLIPPPQG